MLLVGAVLAAPLAVVGVLAAVIGSSPSSTSGTAGPSRTASPSGPAEHAAPVCYLALDDSLRCALVAVINN
jgi:hypothetical protein